MNISERLKSEQTLLCDGAMGTELQRRGLEKGMCPEEFNISHPEVIQSIHSDYISAGSDIIETNTFGGNRARLKMHQFEKRVSEFNQAAVEIAKEVCASGCFVAGSVGPTGELIEPFGDMSQDEAYDIFAEQITNLADAGVDLIFVETMMAAEEAEIAIKAVKENTQLPLVATMTFESGKMGYRTMWGVDIASAVTRLTDAGADIVGSNCGCGFDDMTEIIREMKSLSKSPLIAQSNAGIPETVDGKQIYKEKPEDVKPMIEQLLQLGVKIIGGCCGTGPAHIEMMRGLIDSGN